jgi:NarL family two-component system response regulator LiaR
VLRKLMEQAAAQPASVKPATGPLLTEREGEVIRLVAHGKSNREIAETLVISEKTAKAHISNILGKLGLEDRTQMAIYAIKTGLVNLDQL